MATKVAFRNKVFKRFLHFYNDFWIGLPKEVVRVFSHHFFNCFWRKEGCVRWV